MGEIYGKGEAEIDGERGREGVRETERGREIGNERHGKAEKGQ